MTTPGRWRALQWFADHERDPTAMLFSKRPSRRMIRLMAHEGQLTGLPSMWILTKAGRDVLANKRKRRHARAQQEDPTPRIAGADAPAADL
jgi:hypothetical protein